MRKVSTKLFLRLLSNEHKETRMWVYTKLMDRLTADMNFMTKTIIGNESRVFVYNPEINSKISNGKRSNLFAQRRHFSQM